MEAWPKRNTGRGAGSKKNKYIPSSDISEVGGGSTVGRERIGTRTEMVFGVWERKGRLS
jgi:hypothetical protein